MPRGLAGAATVYLESNSDVGLTLLSQRSEKMYCKAYNLPQRQNRACNLHQVITSAKEVMFLPEFVCLFVCLLAR